ncbi:hypothetical protein TNCT1_24470 [Streptomyces sp. 1-11]|nr:hypothetical protein TNCT1_24470 [Streptomyces sp. 1-11]
MLVHSHQNSRGSPETVSRAARLRRATDATDAADTDGTPHGYGDVSGSPGKRNLQATYMHRAGGGYPIKRRRRS